MLMAQRIVKWFTTWSDIMQYLDDVKLECNEHGITWTEEIFLIDLKLPKESQIDSLQYKVILHI